MSPRDWHGLAARKLVDEQFAKLLLRSDVIESLRIDKSLSDEVRQAALQLAEERYEDPIQLEKAAYNIVIKPGTDDPVALRRALRLVEAACGLYPSWGIAINTLALGQRLPTMYAYRDYVQAAGLVSYGPNIPDLFRRAADYVDKILRGTKPVDLPVEQPTKFDLVISLTTAKALGLTVPSTLLARADEVIE